MANCIKGLLSRDPYDYRYIKELPEDDCEVKPGTSWRWKPVAPIYRFRTESVP